jgi:ABC-type bacteriocin/lantibiotic exporter with double-glycine peptidase domain
VWAFHWQKKLRVICFRAHEAAGNTAFEAVKVQTVYAFGTQTGVRPLYDDALEKAMPHQIRGAVWQGFGCGLSQFFQFFVYAVVFWVGALLIAEDVLSFKKTCPCVFRRSGS